MDLVDTLPDVRYWSEVLCCTIITHISELTCDLKLNVGHCDLYISWSSDFALYLEDCLMYEHLT